MKTIGVGIPWREDAQEHVHTDKGQSLDELDATSFGPGHFLLPYGISVSSNRQKVNAIFGSLAWSFSDDETHQMLSGGLLLDGDSAEILCRRGFRQYVGLDFKRWIKREESKYSLEMVNSKETGGREGFYFSTNRIDRLSVLRPQRGAQEWTTIITPERKRLGAGIVVYKNKLGGRVVSYAAPNPSLLPSAYQRQMITQKSIEFLSSGRFSSPMVTGGANFMPIHFVGRDKCFVVIFNGSPDRTKPVVRMEGVVVRHIQATLLPPLAEPVKAKVSIVSKAKTVTVVSQTEVPYLGYLVLEYPASSKP